jgi:hypothetical protein
MFQMKDVVINKAHQKYREETKNAIKEYQAGGASEMATNERIVAAREQLGDELSWRGKD